MTQELKPCPFCGSGRVIMKDTYLGSKMVVCIDCGVGTGDYVTGEYAVDTWNTRAEAEAKRAGVEAKRAGVDQAYIDEHGRIIWPLSERERAIVARLGGAR